MPKITFELQASTPREWTGVILDHFDEFMQDHANCERKASALALSLVMKYPDRKALIPHLIRLAQEELEHFQEVYALMEARDIPIGKEIKDPYVNQLLSHCRSEPEERFLDRMLISSIIEARGAERFGLIADALEEPELKAFYKRLWAAEMKHGHLFANLMLHYFSETEIQTRLQPLLAAEAEIVQGLEWRPSLH
ncbi:MAG: tRNA-(ms[2]io[6]A)-hydroxylase [Candidatus Sericytochromatia bacterium]|nr:tRNA-(ms[2]io[6]A)-hydroxylase [Candidatus Sericytochromatia bacterium]